MHARRASLSSEHSTTSTTSLSNLLRRALHQRPCSPDSDSHPHPPPFDAQPSRKSSTSSCEAMTPEETRDLWLCMLELQGRYGCYNSTRMDLAMEAGEDAEDLMRECLPACPSKSNLHWSSWEADSYDSKSVHH